MYKRILQTATALLVLGQATTAFAGTELEALANISLEELINVEVMSVSKKKENRFQAAAAVHVITSDDIRRSGATSIPEILREVPGLEVARIDSNKWAISARGFNRQFSNKLLVLFDGRTVYTPLFSGVYWDIQDTLLEDIDRIEVIRGPGATLWGANAVNGIINIITKNAKFTQGNYASLLYGNHEEGNIEARHGGKTANDIYYRFYGKYFNRDGTKLRSGANAGDDWGAGRSGFRLDWRDEDDANFTMHGNVFDGKAQQNFYLPNISAVTDGDERFDGANIVAKWDKTLAENSQLSLQTYVDYIERVMENILDQRRMTFDSELQHNWQVSDRHSIIWGGGFRYFADSLKSIPASNGVSYLDYEPDRSDNHLYSLFAQDEISLLENELYLILGSKFEHFYHTGWEIQPNARIKWLPDDNQTLWASVSRAVRTPSRAERGLSMTGSYLPAGTIGTGTPGGFVLLNGDTNYDSEKLTAYEIGYRIQPAWWVSFDATAFYNVYDDFRTFETVSAFPDSDTSLVLEARNLGKGKAHGVELSTRWSVQKNWNIYANYTYFTLDMDLKPGSADTTAATNENFTPRHRFNVLSRINLPYNIELDNNLYYASPLSPISSGNVDPYMRFDTRISWKPQDNIELSLVGQNLFDHYHQEFSEALFSAPSLIGRSFYAKAAIKF